MGVEKKEASYAIGENVHCAASMENRIEVPQKKNLKLEPPHDPASPLLGTHPEKTIIPKDTCTPGDHCSAI